MSERALSRAPPSILNAWHQAGRLIHLTMHKPQFNQEIIMTQLDKVLYTAKTHTTGGRDGASRSSDGILDI